MKCEAELNEREQAILHAMERMKKIQFNQLYPSLSSGEQRLIHTVAACENGIKVSALAEELGMPMPAVSRMMRGLEMQDLIARKIVPHDRRSIIVTLTPKGEEAAKEMLSQLHSFLSSIFEPLNPEDFDRFLENWEIIMDRIETVLQEQLAHAEAQDSEPKQT